jgi:hypothetical protein
MLRPLALALLSVIAVRTAPAQPAPAQPATALNVYLDCEWSGCDFDYFRTELTMVNWVRDRQVSDVHILVSTQDTGAGGREYTVTFIGLKRFAGIADTLAYVSEPAATQNDRRQGLARVFRLGLVRYIARTPDAAKLTIGFTAPTGGAQTTAKRDRWNYWVFRTSINGNFNGEKTYLSYGVYGNFNADRVTKDWKTRFSIFESYNQSEFEIDPAQPRFVNISRSYGTSALQVKSLTEHWSAGARLNLSSSTYNNYRRAIQAFPALEYNLFPYSQSTRRQMRLEYNLGWADFAYNDTTINDRMREGLPLHRLTMSVVTRETWGSIDVGSLATGYLDDRNKYRISTYAELSLRLFRGFSLQGFGNYEMIRDQFNLAKKNFTPEEILTRRFQRGTGYRYFAYFGLSYTFGSIYNNVVNPRMSGSFFE